MFQTLVPPTHEAFEKAVDARISDRKDIMRHINNNDVKAAVQMADPFYPDLLPCNAIKDAFSSMPSVPLHVHHAQHLTSGCKGAGRRTLANFFIFF